MDIFVMGATGYLGSAAARALVEAGHSVSALVRSDSSEAQVKALGARAVRGDLAQPASYEAPLDAADGVVFAASGRGEAWGKVDKTSMDAVTAQLSGADKPFVRVVGSMVYGDTGEQPTAEDAPLSAPPFLEPVAEMEQRLLEHPDLRAAFVHAPLVYGRGDGDIPKVLISAARNSNAALYIGDGANAWDTVHVDDVGRLIAKVVGAPGSEGRYVAAGSALTMKEVAEAIAAQLGLESTKSLSPDEAEEPFGFFATPLTLNQRFDGSRAAALGWTRREPAFAASLGGY